MKFAAGLLALASAEVKIIGGFTPTPNSEPYILSLQKVSAQKRFFSVEHIFWNMFCRAALTSAVQLSFLPHAQFVPLIVISEVESLLLPVLTTSQRTSQASRSRASPPSSTTRATTPTPSRTILPFSTTPDSLWTARSPLFHFQVSQTKNQLIL